MTPFIGEGVNNNAAIRVGAAPENYNTAGGYARWVLAPNCVFHSWSRNWSTFLREKLNLISWTLQLIFPIRIFLKTGTLESCLRVLRTRTKLLVPELPAPKYIFAIILESSAAIGWNQRQISFFSFAGKFAFCKLRSRNVAFNLFTLPPRLKTIIFWENGQEVSFNDRMISRCCYWYHCHQLACLKLSYRKLLPHPSSTRGAGQSAEHS